MTDDSVKSPFQSLETSKLTGIYPAKYLNNSIRKTKETSSNAPLVPLGYIRSQA